MTSSMCLGHVARLYSYLLSNPCNICVVRCGRAEVINQKCSKWLQRTICAATCPAINGNQHSCACLDQLILVLTFLFLQSPATIPTRFVYTIPSRFHKNAKSLICHSDNVLIATSLNSNRLLSKVILTTLLVHYLYHCTFSFLGMCLLLQKTLNGRVVMFIQ